MSTIYETLKKDHDKHREMLDLIASTSGDNEMRRDVWDKFYHDVSAHAAAEEETFYSKLISTEDGQPEGRHSVAEHKELDDLMEELNDTDMSSPAWLTKFKKLKDRYEHHMEEEENDVFPVAKETVGKDGNEKLGSAFKKRKEAEFELVEEKAEEKLEE
ncbi:hemerythrin domain-containing protein [Henriciella algicola]|jgi:hemerythrin superfamily protein|uniref:Hemerythrin domain-containing protein n=1 Tax=Henriciella algicola TaxID=1608422 RepID=A0A399RKZ7_9PROT|nr:hemerythrin domain-containing protein [Henriciella algicola]RIJ30954.1 hemerythrin domain-containing protein [Henriciella algicola]